MHIAGDKLPVLFVALSLFWTSGIAQDSCTDWTDCGGCISFPSTQCLWCADDDARITGRCQESYTPSECQNIQNPLSGVDDSEVPAPPPGIMMNPVTPTSYTISVRPAVPLTISINVTTVRNVPLDLYLLFDLSTSMAEEVAAAANASRLIADGLSTLTSDVLLGFGGFSDKPTRPYTRLPTGTVAETCGPSGCYDFRHFVNLTSDSVALANRILEIADRTTGQLSGNVDAPEAGLEAIGQVAMCDEAVGWRENSVKIILYWSDDAFHFAGEGRYAGIMKPYLEECQLSGDFNADRYLEYIGWSEYDYPSVGQVLTILRRANIFPVFIAVDSSTQDSGFYSVAQTHEVLADLFDINFRASFAELETEQGSDNLELQNNILTIIDTQVLEILNETRLTPESVDGLSISIQAMCPPSGNLGPDNDSCSDVGVDTTTVFDVTVSLDSCEDFGTERKTVTIQVAPVGTVQITVEPICSCDCEEDVEINSTRCSNNGDFACGICDCYDGWCGFNCSIRLDDTTTCPVGIGGEDCSNRGTCAICECLCDDDLTDTGGQIDERLLRPGVLPGTFGDACQCDYYSCLDPDNETHTEVCSGRGVCCNGGCICNINSENGYRYRNDPTDDNNGPANDCDCEPEELVCRQPGSEDICNGRGTCGCTECECSDPFTGQYCREVDQIECTDLGTRDQLGTCILAEKSRDGRSNSDCVSCDDIQVSCVLIIPESEQPTSTSFDDVEAAIEMYASQEMDDKNFEFHSQCFFTDESNCTHDFYIVFNEDDAEIVIVAEEQRSCPQGESESLLSIPLWTLAIILLAVLLGLGILILILIKIIFVLLDYIEVKRLEKEVGLADFSKNQNPLYQSPDVEYKNVAYGKE